MKFALSAWMASLLILSIAAAPVPEPQANTIPTAAPRMLKRAVAPRGEKLQYAAAERLRRNQVNPVTMRNPVARFLDSRWFHKDSKPSPSPSHKPSGKASPKPSPSKSSWWKRNNDGKPSVKPSPKPSKSYKPSPSPKYAVCPYSGKQADTDYCKEESTVDGCTAYSYDVTKSTLDLNKGNEFEEDGSVEFAYIPLSEYKGWGSAAQPDPSWKPVKAKIEFGSKQTYGTDFVGESSLPWDAITELPESGYCITWVKVSNFVQEYGIGGSGPVCYCPGKKL